MTERGRKADWVIPGSEMNAEKEEAELCRFRKWSSRVEQI